MDQTHEPAPDSPSPDESPLPERSESTTSGSIRRWLLTPVVLAGLGGVLVLAVVVTWLAWPDPLAERDPAGYRACVMLTDYQTGKLDDDQVTVAVALGTQ